MPNGKKEGLPAFAGLPPSPEALAGRVGAASRDHPQMPFTYPLPRPWAKAGQSWSNQNAGMTATLQLWMAGRAVPLPAARRRCDVHTATYAGRRAVDCPPYHSRPGQEWPIALGLLAKNQQNRPKFLCMKHLHTNMGFPNRGQSCLIVANRVICRDQSSANPVFDRNVQSFRSDRLRQSVTISIPPSSIRPARRKSAFGRVASPRRPRTARRAVPTIRNALRRRAKPLAQAGLLWYDARIGMQKTSSDLNFSKRRQPMIREPETHWVPNTDVYVRGLRRGDQGGAVRDATGEPGVADRRAAG